MLSPRSNGLIKVFGSADGGWNSVSRWAWMSIRNPLYAWVQSGAASNEYYLTRADNGSIPTGLLGSTSAELAQNGTPLTPGTVGSLAAGQWGFGNIDSLPRQTLYVHIGADPDTLPLDALTYRALPTADDSVVLGENSGSITGDLSTPLPCADLLIDPDYAGTIGTPDQYLRVSLAVEEAKLQGSGTYYLRFETTSQLRVHVGAPDGSGPTVFLRTELPNASAYVYGGTVRIGNGMSRIRNLFQQGGRVIVDDTVWITETDALIDMHGGSLHLACTMRAGNVQCRGGEVLLAEPFSLDGAAAGQVLISGSATVQVESRQPIKKLVLQHAQAVAELSGPTWITTPELAFGTATVRGSAGGGQSFTITATSVPDMAELRVSEVQETGLFAG